MSDDNDDLDAFARLFGAEPETPPEGLLPLAEAKPIAPAAPPAAGDPGDPLAWLLSAPPAFPSSDAAWPTPAVATTAFADYAAFPSSTAPAEPTQVLPTRRSVAAEAAAAASRDTGRRNLIILGSIGAVVLILLIVLVMVLVAKSSSSGSADATSRHTDQPSTSSSSTPSATPTPTPTASDTPTPTPTPSQSHTVVPPPPSPPAVTAAVSVQPNCSGTAPFTVTIGYTSANAATLNVMSSDGTVNTNITPAASGTIPPVPYQCGTGASYTLTVYSSAEGVTPSSTTVTPVPN